MDSILTSSWHGVSHSFCGHHKKVVEHVRTRALSLFLRALLRPEIQNFSLESTSSRHEVAVIVDWELKARVGSIDVNDNGH